MFTLLSLYHRCSYSVTSVPCLRLSSEKKDRRETPEEVMRGRDIKVERKKD